MTQNLRDRLFSDTGGVVQGATVQAILVTGAGTDAGASSVVQATTSTDVNGVWKFTNLPDPGTGNWYDVKIINGNQVRWRYGNIQATLNAILLGNASYQVTSLGVGTGAPVLTGQVQTSGGLGVAAAPTTADTIVVGGSNTSGIRLANSASGQLGFISHDGQGWTHMQDRVSIASSQAAVLVTGLPSPTSSVVVLVVNVSAAQAAFFLLQGAANAAVLGPVFNGIWGTGNGTPNSQNVFYNSGQYLLQNMGASLQTYNVQAWSF